MEFQKSLDPGMPDEPLVMEEFVRAARLEVLRMKKRFPCEEDGDPYDY